MQECFITKDVWTVILQYCNLESLCALRCTCKAMCALSSSQTKYVLWKNMNPYQRFVSCKKEWGSPLFLKTGLNSYKKGFITWHDLHRKVQQSLRWNDDDYVLVLLHYQSTEETYVELIASSIMNHMFPSRVWRKFVNTTTLKQPDLDCIMLSVFRKAFFFEQKNRIDFAIKNGVSVQTHCFFDTSPHFIMSNCSTNFLKYVLLLIPWVELMKLREFAQKKSWYYFRNSWHLVEEEYQHRLSVKK